MGATQGRPRLARLALLLPPSPAGLAKVQVDTERLLVSG
jgi:hypothetical protein